MFENFFNKGDDSDEDYEHPKHRTETETQDVARRFTEYKVEIEYDDGSSRTEYVTEHRQRENHIELYDHEPQMGSRYKCKDRGTGIPSRWLPRIQLKDGEPLIISLANVYDIDISKYQELVYVCRDVEYEQTYRQHEPDGEWEELYEDFEVDGEYDIETWHKPEWEAVTEE